MNLTPDVFGTDWDVELMAVYLSSGIRNTTVSNPRDTLGLKCRCFGCFKHSGTESGVAFPVQADVSTALFL